jgi:hypothetical protein
LYSSELQVTIRNLESIISYARELGVGSIMKLATTYLINFDEENIFRHLNIASETSRNTFSSISEHSSSLLRSSGILQCDLDILEKLLGCDELKVKSELDVFYAILGWIDYDEDHRLQCAPFLMKKIILQYVKPEDIYRIIEPQRKLFQRNDCREILGNAYWLEIKTLTDNSCASIQLYIHFQFDPLIKSTRSVFLPNAYNNS